MDELYRDLFAQPSTKRVIAPRPGPDLFTRNGLRPAAGAPPALGSGRNPDAVYLLDAGVGSGFAHARRLDLLATHYNEQLAYTLAVFNEWDSHAHRQHRAGRPGETAQDRIDRELYSRLRAAGRVLIENVENVLGPAVELGYDQIDPIRRLHDELEEMTGSPKAHHAQHAGECESIRYGQMLLADGRAVVVLCANDHDAQRLAYRHTIARRNMYEVLGEMAEEGHISHDEVFDLYFKMAEVTQLPAEQRPPL